MTTPVKPDSELSITEHLEELRVRIIKGIIAILVITPFAWMFSLNMLDYISNDLCRPYIPELYYMAPFEMFLLRLKLTLITSVFAASPFLAYQMWAFISPALMKTERRLALILSVLSFVFFTGGAAFALLAIFPIVMKYSAAFGADAVSPMLNVTSVVNLALMLCIGFGLCFLLPLVVFAMLKTGICTIGAVKKARPYIIVAIFIVAGIITPPDVLSQLALAIPCVILFELSLLAASISMKKSKTDKELKHDPE